VSDRLRHFLLVFDHDKGELIQNREFKSPSQALTAYSATERSYTRDQNVEVVLIGADSLATVRRTHANYFPGGGVAASVQKYLVGLGLDG